MTITDTDRQFLVRAVELAEQALESGDQPFGSVLVSKDGEILFEDHNHVAGGNHTLHPELAIAQWAAENMSPEDRAAATVYTSGEHCPMCAGAHGWAGLGRVVYAAAASQLVEWSKELGFAPSPVAALPIQQIVPGIVVDGPDPELSERVRGLHARR